jgi:hypothetical protein
MAKERNGAVYFAISQALFFQFRPKNCVWAIQGAYPLPFESDYAILINYHKNKISP